MATAQELEDARMDERGTDVEAVRGDLRRVIDAAGSVAAAGTRLGYSPAAVSNFEAGRQSLSSGILLALYGEAGCDLDDGLLVASEAELSIDTGGFDPPEQADPEVAPEDEDQSGHAADDADFADPEPKYGKTFEDVGDLLERRARERRGMLPAAAAQVEAIDETLLVRAATEKPDRPPELVAERPNLDRDGISPAPSPIAMLVRTLDDARVLIIAAAARAKAEIETDAAARLAAIDAKRQGDLDALDRAAAVLAEVG